MQIHNLRIIRILNKRGRGFLLLPFLLLIFCCNGDLSKYGRDTLHDASKDSKQFIFTVSDEFVKKTKDTKPDVDYPRMNVAEVKLLTYLLKEKGYCLSNGSPQFVVNPRQEKIYDMTFAHLIEENYNLRPIAPRMYFGSCRPN